MDFKDKDIRTEFHANVRSPNGRIKSDLAYGERAIGFDSRRMIQEAQV